MPRVRPLEVKALTPLLEQDWETPEALAEALILELDNVRASRTSYVGVLQVLGAIYTGVGPYPGVRSAQKALMNHPAMGDETLVTGAIVIPIETPEGFEKRIKELDALPKSA